MGRRLVVNLHEEDYAALKKKANAAGLNISNFIRQACGLPLEKQGVKRSPKKAK
jgi:predicted DNA binding CopG/RHH family protein